MRPVSVGEAEAEAEAEAWRAGTGRRCLRRYMAASAQPAGPVALDGPLDPVHPQADLAGPGLGADPDLDRPGGDQRAGRGRG